jgi:hypothetical protein
MNINTPRKITILVGLPRQMSGSGKKEECEMTVTEAKLRIRMKIQSTAIVLDREEVGIAVIALLIEESLVVPRRVIAERMSTVVIYSMKNKKGWREKSGKKC